MTTPSSQPNEMAPTHVRYHVLGFLCVMAFILYLHRICISQAMLQIKESLGIENNKDMGYVLGAFTLAYGLFEVPAGHLGDRHGSRKVLTLVVCWFSVFTMITGLCTDLLMLLIVRFLFGAGEAGALPNAIRVVTRWFPAQARGPALGLVLTSALVGGAVAPVLAEQLIGPFGWRLAFVALGIPGLLWAAWFYWWFRDDPAEHPAINDAERRYLAQGRGATNHAHDHQSIPWKRVLTGANIWLLGGIGACCAFTTYLFFSWYATYLAKGRSLPSGLSSQLASMVLVGGAVGSFAGGYVSDWLVRRTGERKWSRRLLGVLALGSAAWAMVLSIHFDNPWLAASCATWACFAVHLQLPAVWGVVTEISGPHVGALWGLINSMGVPSAIGSQIFLGHFADHLGELGYVGREQWDPAFYVYAGLLLLGAVLWLFVDSEKKVVDFPSSLAA